MELSLFLAQVMGIVISAFAIASLIRPAIIRDAIRDFDHESFARLVIGCMAIALGAVLVLTHNVWVKDFRVVITIFGWTALLKGIGYLVAPKLAVNFTKSMLKSKGQMQLFLLVCLALGIYLAYTGFGY
jgi:uncharacterized protein YjeT (DUF2065 family)